MGGRFLECVNCGRELSPAPTEVGHTDCGPHGKICFECVEKLHKTVMAVRHAAETEMAFGGMRVRDLLDFFELYAPMEGGTYLERHMDNGLFILVKERSIGPRAMVGVKSMNFGFDWENNRLILVPNEDLKIIGRGK